MSYYGKGRRDGAWYARQRKIREINEETERMERRDRMSGGPLVRAAAIRYERVRQSEEFAAGVAAMRVAADEVYAIGDEIAVVTFLKARGGWTALLTAAFRSATSTPEVQGAVAAEDMQAVRAAAFHAAEKKGA